VGIQGSFEIFRSVPNGEPTWLESCASLESAMARAHEMDSTERGDYFIFDRQNHKFFDAGHRQPVKSAIRIMAADEHNEMRKGLRRLLQKR
jgi:hypothetical protein